MIIAAVVAGAFATSVCIPTPNGVQLQAYDTTNVMYQTAQQYLDVSAQSFRSTDLADLTHHQQFTQDVLILAANSLSYITTGVPGKPATFHCRISHEQQTVQYPCLTHNGTKIMQVLVGDTLTDEFTGQDDHHGVTTYSDILITPLGIPVHFTQYNDLGHFEALYLNFTQTIPANAFTPPSICNNAEPLGMPLVSYLKQNKMEHVLRNLKL